VSEPASVLERLVEQLDQLAERLRDERLDSSEATELLEQVTRLVGEAVHELERQAEALDSQELP
jgi:RNase H-fold protein (predicted Holliday junction resolvase)